MSGKRFLLGMEARLSCIARHWPFLRILARLLAGSTVGGAQAFHSPAITDDVFDLDLAKVSTRWQSVHTCCPNRSRHSPRRIADCC